jgi:hypothetical protein
MKKHLIAPICVLFAGLSFVFSQPLDPRKRADELGRLSVISGVAKQLNEHFQQEGPHLPLLITIAIIDDKYYLDEVEIVENELEKKIAALGAPENKQRPIIFIFTTEKLDVRVFNERGRRLRDLISKHIAEFAILANSDWPPEGEEEKH